MKRGVVEHSYPLWLRTLAYACLLLVAGISTVQAVHIHGDWLPQRSVHVGALPDGSQTPGGEEHCPLCVAMHSSLPVAAHVEIARLVLVECDVAQPADRVPETAWHFAMFSRPPPVKTL